MKKKEKAMRFKSGDLIKPKPRLENLDLTGAKSNRFIWRNDGYSGSGFKIGLYRFLRDTIPVLNACIWTWSRLSSAPGGYEIIDSAGKCETEQALEYLDRMSLRVYPHRFQKTAGLDSFLPLLFNALFTDGAFTGFLIINPDISGVDHFQPIDPTDICHADSDNGKTLVYQTQNGEIRLDGDDFYYLGLSSKTTSGSLPAYCADRHNLS